MTDIRSSLLWVRHMRHNVLILWNRPTPSYMYILQSFSVQLSRDSILSPHTTAPLKWTSNNVPNYLDNESRYRQTDCYIVLAVTISSCYLTRLFISSKITILTFTTFAPIISTTTWRICLKFNLDRVLMYI